MAKNYYLLTGLTSDQKLKQLCIEVLHNDPVMARPLNCPTQGDRVAFWREYLQGTDIDKVTKIQPLVGLMTAKRVDTSGATIGDS